MKLEIDTCESLLVHDTVIQNNPTNEVNITITAYSDYIMILLKLFFIATLAYEINSVFVIKTLDKYIYTDATSSIKYEYNSQHGFRIPDNSQQSTEDEISNSKANLGRGTHGGIACGACTVLLGMGEQLADINNETLAEGLERLCIYLPSPLSTDCINVVLTLGPAILDFLRNSSTPDSVCYSVGLCEADPHVCNLFPAPAMQRSSLHSKFYLNAQQKRDVTESMVKAFPWLCYIPGVSQICEAFERTFHDLVPGLDIDEDGFSPAETFRGALWRGRDCHDGKADIHPGRRPTDSDRYIDSNCNGIFGVNKLTGLPWEEELCDGTAAKGIIYLGDSVGAHFHMPPQWFSPGEMTSTTFTNITEVITNEGDWPHLGFATGFRNSSMNDLIDGKVDSIYLRLLSRNRCIHRDYQNLARNGANSTDTLFYIKALAQSKRDMPAIVFYALIGNDVCTEKPDPDAMTTKQKFLNNTLTVLDILEKQLAPGSHVVLVGLIDAGFLYDAMSERVHPLGKINNNVRYKDMYRWFNCMEIGPCAGWLNPDKQLREKTSTRSKELSQVLADVAATRKYYKFDVTYIDNPFHQVIDNWVAGGGQVHQLVEPVDSLHPTQVAQSLIAEQVWSDLERKAPHILGPVNPNNQMIQELFGDQGGH